MSANMSYHCTSSPMEEHRTENLWSECFQDLGSWCHQPQDELNTPNVTNQSELNFSFDDQSMYYPWEANSSSVELKGDMWKQPQSDLLSLQYPTEEDNSNSLMQTISDNQSALDTSIRYSCNLVLTPDIDQDMDNCQDNFKTVNWNDLAPLQTPNTNKSLNTISTKRKNIPQKEEQTINKSKPHLKLNIAAANKAPATSDLATTITMNTPDVVNSLLDETDFNIISYVEGYDEQSLMAVDPNSIVSQRPKESQATSQQVIKIDHDYAETLSSGESMVCQPASSVSQGDEILPAVIEDNEDFKPCIAVKDEPLSPTPSTSTTLGKRVRKSMAVDDDFIYDDDPPSDHSSDWSPFNKKKAKTAKKKSGEGSRTRTSSISDSSSVTSGSDKYRELRDRNNEASRRSRMNRKQKEVEMMEKANFLHRENGHLKNRAEALEKRVKALRQILLKVVLEKNKSI